MASSSDESTQELDWETGAADTSPSYASGDDRPLRAAPVDRLPLDDPERLGALLTSLESRLQAFALRITRHPEGARDVVQNAFEKVIRHGESFHGESRVSTWVHRIVANEALIWLRSQRRRAEVQAEVDTALVASLADDAPGPAERLQQSERERQLLAGLGHLPEEDRDLLLRCALADESYADYGARTATPRAAVKSRAFRARRRLGVLLRDTLH